ncbi:MAG: hypothetical protein OMM_09013 [Candidatus Magnetoglobus multicellularis str. Araruama]|uniref:Uncharacterized protein n=1 Tax=Candidatus Magnetoglobus multicellularis str. Araruama TaxID=890399 RepID=A0A1V1P5T1_9BACT|nr:MAG: hypothetical protein OMM_09013 [Candidatus Magnetoglobus multicellularis str. Araruama]
MCNSEHQKTATFKSIDFIFTSFCALRTSEPYKNYFVETIIWLDHIFNQSINLARSYQDLFQSLIVSDQEYQRQIFWYERIDQTNLLEWR